MNQAPYSETDIITIPELRRRLKIRKQTVYDMISEAGCPVYNAGGGDRVIWGEFLEWYKKRFKKASGD
ncbi:hypothetical protein NYE69_06730 [Paenibacillus sp. FSL R5-0527]|uniref:hypothetical protein n=1 Tax=Paenibacillus sp. FSL R5-0527 TaxID=2975321 RepID=UPI00097B98C4|nr:hypothetical protein BK140_09145 [Paenibacillus macerans]